jgi:two-component sensor histidine kinase
MSALRRLGVVGEIVGQRLSDLLRRVLPDPLEAADVMRTVRTAAAGKPTANTEVSNGQATVRFGLLPLVPSGNPLGALVVAQDVTELRRRDRQIMSKDATIREIHHRVKNNLQTVAALLRLQARRLRAPEARAALDEAVRRVGSIAVVHETLSHAPEEVVDFDDIADRVARMAGEVSAAEVGVIPKITGSFGQLSAAVATPLAMVLTELLQNALQHGFSGPQAAREPGLIEVVVVREPERLTVTVADTGVGLPEGFELDSATSLGLQIVRTLVVGELGGRLRITPRPGGGTEAVVDLPIGSEPDRETVT